VIEYIKNNDRLLAIIVKKKHIQKEGTEFLTSSSSTQQIGCIAHKAGTVIDAHVHNQVKREVFYTHETLIIKSGKVRVDFYDDDKNYFLSTEIEEGDVILFTEGGHGFKYLQDTQLIEIKQGPYLEHDDKVRFKGVSDAQVKIK
jgi:mannose-6-phosphate isomerase-like protein (cupin superfamily)